METTEQFKFHHLGVAVSSIGKSLPFYEELFGYRLVSGPFVDPIQRVSVCFLQSGEGGMTIELVEPLDGVSPVRKLLEKGTAAYHVCYEVENLENILRVAADKGCVVVAQPAPAVAFGNRRIAWFYTPTRQLIEVLEKSLER